VEKREIVIAGSLAGNHRQPSSLQASAFISAAGATRGEGDRPCCSARTWSRPSGVIVAAYERRGGPAVALDWDGDTAIHCRRLVWCC